jgi:hypothetical protein
MGRRAGGESLWPVEPSLSGEGPGARSPAREVARHRGSTAFGRRIREGDLPRVPVRAGTRSEGAARLLRFQDKLRAGNGKRMKSTACSARGRKARPSWLRQVVDRTDACEGVTKSSHRGTCNCGGGRRTRPTAVSGLSECPCGAWAARVEALGVSVVAWMRLVPGIRRDRWRRVVFLSGKAATARVSDSFHGGGDAHHSSCSHDRDFRHGRPVLADGRDGGFERVRR